MRCRRVVCISLLDESFDSSVTRTMRLSVRFLSLSSGFLGATASCLGKFALDPDSFVALWTQQHLCRSDSLVHGWWWCWAVALIARGACLVGMITCNAFMLSSFVQGMVESGSIAGTALASAANFAVSALYGYWLWNERFPLQWWIGFSMVLAGVTLLSTVQVVDVKNKKIKSD